MVKRKHHNTGLTGEQVIASRQQHGDNVITPPKREPLWKQFLAKFDDPLIKILLVALVLSVGLSIYEYCWLGMGASILFEPMGIFIAIVLATLVGFLVEVNANKKFRLLNQSDDHVMVNLLVNLRLRISAVENNIRQQVDSLRQMLLQDGRIIDRVLLLRKSIQVAAHALQCVEYLHRAPARRSLEGDVLHEMRQSLLPRFLIPCSRSYLITTINHRRGRRQMNHPQSVGQSISIIIHKFAK